MSTRGRSKVFWIGTAVSLLLITGIVVIPPLVTSGPDEVKIGSFGEASQPVLDTAELIADADEDIEVATTNYATLAQGEAALAEGEIDALLVDGVEVVTGGEGSFATNQGSRVLQDAALAVAVERLTVEQGVDPADIVALLTDEALATRTLSGADDADPTREIVAYIGLMLMYMAILLYGAWTLAGVTEEKANRVVEIIVSTIEPWHLLAGKVLGVATLAMSQFLTLLGYGLVLVRATDRFEIGAVPLDSAAMLVLWFVLGYAIYAVLFAMVGALISRAEEAQSAATPITVVAVAAFMVTFAALDNPSGLVAKVATFVPLTAPYVVPVRYSLEAIAWWEVALAACITAASAYVLIRVAGRLYRGALLSYSGRAKVRSAWANARH